MGGRSSRLSVPLWSGVQDSSFSLVPFSITTGILDDCIWMFYNSVTVIVPLLDWSNRRWGNFSYIFMLRGSISMLVSRLIGRLVGSVMGRLVGRLVGWLVGWSSPLNSMIRVICGCSK